MGHGKDEERNTLSRGTARPSGADGIGSRGRIREQTAAILSISQKVGCSRDSLRIWAKQHETDTGKRDGVTTAGSVGDSYDNALAETIIGLFKTEAINQLGPWKSKDHIEWETLQWVDWFNKERLLEPLGYITPIEAEEKYKHALKSD